MEVKHKIPAWLDESHPNYLRWKIARDLSIDRGKFVQSVINQQLQTKNLAILDLGSGEGGTSKVFSKNNFVVSLDLSLVRLQRQNHSVISKDPECFRDEKSSTITEDRFLPLVEMTASKNPSFLTRVNGSALLLPFANNSFDLIIIQDVIEHLVEVKDFYSEVNRVLKTNGIIYLSTPNKLSLFNFVADPHFGLPLLSLLKRNSIKKYFLKYFRKDDYNRNDIAQLLSLNELIKMFKKDFEISLNTKFSVRELFNRNKGIVWSDFHLKIVSYCKFFKLDLIINKTSNDKFGFINKYFTPTFYFVLGKK